MKPFIKFMTILSFAPLFFACGLNPDKTESELTVKVSKATLANNVGEQDFPFISKPYRTSELSFRIGGPITKFDVFSGNHYKRGELIAQIDPRDFVIRKNKAEAIYNQAKAEADRIEILYKKNNISGSSYEKAKADCIAAKMAYETAVNELSDTRLIAPFDGYVATVSIEQYQDVKATQPIVSLVDIHRLKIETYIPQSVAIHAKKGQNVNLSFDAAPDKIYTATIEEVSKSTTKNNLSYLLTATLPNPNDELLAGMSGKLLFNLQPVSVEKEIVIPQTALCHRTSVGNYVWVVDSKTSKVHLRKVTIGGLKKNGVVIREGLNEGDVVATSGLRFLSDDKQVTISTK